MFKCRDSVVPPGLTDFSGTVPNVETLGYYQMSRWDKETSMPPLKQRRKPGK